MYKILDIEGNLILQFTTFKDAETVVMLFKKSIGDTIIVVEPNGKIHTYVWDNQYQTYVLFSE